MQSLKSRGYVRENFAWRHYYWYLTVMMETEIHTDEKVVVVMHAWTREVLEITSNQNSVVEWGVLEEDVVDHQQVVDSVLLHLPALEDLEPRQVKVTMKFFGVIHLLKLMNGG